MSDSDEPTTAPQDADDKVLAEGAARPASGGPGATIRRTVFKRPGTREQEPASEATQAELSEVTATNALLDRSGAEQITAERVSMDRSGAKTIETKSAQLDRSGVVALGSEHSVLMRSSAVQVVAEEARIVKSAAVWISADQATIEDSRIIFFSGSATGEVKTVFTPLTAAVFGGAAGLVLVLMSAFRRGMRRRA